MNVDTLLYKFDQTWKVWLSKKEKLATCFRVKSNLWRQCKNERELNQMVQLFIVHPARMLKQIICFTAKATYSKLHSYNYMGTCSIKALHPTQHSSCGVALVHLFASITVFAI
jgi:hypothetical protein